MDKKLGLQSVMETVDYVRKAWGNIGLPSNLAPTMNIEELDKRVTDLKAVEQWLSVNQSMLRGTIQALEVQRNTIAAVQAFGNAVKTGIKTSPSDAISQEFAKAFSAPTAAPTLTQPMAAPDSNVAGAWWDMLQSQFNQIAQAALAGDKQSSNQGGQLKRAAKKVASNMANSVANSVANKVANKVANSVATSVANKVASEVKKRATGQTAKRPAKKPSKLTKAKA